MTRTDLALALKLMVERKQSGSLYIFATFLVWCVALYGLYVRIGLDAAVLGFGLYALTVAAHKSANYADGFAAALSVVLQED